MSPGAWHHTLSLSSQCCSWCWSTTAGTTAAAALPARTAATASPPLQQPAAAKVRVRELLLAGCGQAPEARLVPEQSGAAAAAAAGQMMLPGWQLQVQLIDNKTYEALCAQQPRPLTLQQLVSCVVRERPLLKCGAGQPGSCITLPLQAGAACLDGLHCMKPERAEDGTKHSGRTTRCRLLLTVTAAAAAAAAQAAFGPAAHQAVASPGVAPLVSEAFTVVTTRSRSAVKSVVPLPGEAAGRLEGIGKDAAASLRALTVLEGKVLGPVETVGQFYALQQWVAEGGIPRLQQLLTATGIKAAAYKQAAEHVQRTAFPDFRPRVWWWEGQARGLLCSWSQAETAPGPPLAWALQQQQGKSCLLVPLNLPADATALRQAVQLAKQEWLAEGHGSWEVFWRDEADPLAQAWAAQGMLLDLRALPAGIYNAAAAAAAAAAGSTAALPPPAQAAAPAAAVAAAAEPAASVQMLLPALQPLQLPAAALPPAQLQQQQQLLQQQPIQVQQQPPTPALQSQMFAGGLQQQLLTSQQQQQAWQQLQQEIEQLARQQDVLKRQQQLLLQLGPMQLPVPAMPPTPSSLSEPLMPASETADHPLVQAQLLAQTSDASTLMDQQLLQQAQLLQEAELLQQAQKRQKLHHCQQQQGQLGQGAGQIAADDGEDGGSDGVVVNALADTVAGGAAAGAAAAAAGAAAAAAEESLIELLVGEAVVMEERVLSIDRFPSLETFLRGDFDWCQEAARDLGA